MSSSTVMQRSQSAQIVSEMAPRETACLLTLDPSVVALPVKSAQESSKPPIDDSAGAMGRTAPMKEAHTDAVKHLKSKPKGCGRADCCQLNGAPKVIEKFKTFPQFQFKPYQPGTELIFPAALSKHELKPLKFGSSVRQWYRPTSLAQLLELKKSNPSAKLVGGSSEVAIEVGILGRQYPDCISVADIPELYGYELPKMDDEHPTLTFGANLPLSELEEVCKTLAKELPSSVSGPVKAIRDQLR